MVVAVAENTRKEVRVNHIDKTLYPEKRISVTDLKMSTTETQDEYHNLIVMALKICGSLAKQEFVSVGMEVFVFSDFLGRCKLGKNTALVYGLVLAFLAANKLLKNITKKQIL